ncbi:MAG: amidohydrolase family protein [Dehalococcoidales bacterium]|jgi:predicted TIM-barrel fold metal-dependent hydrolase|nr:amidohydrolase family protein [Dehalococcoidales bacterium]|tara:strand:+ start:260 stop:544 length:285 start_codon:yes stop_codon:yes gene_type:complete
MHENEKVIDADGHLRDRDADIRAFMEELYGKRGGAFRPYAMERVGADQALFASDYPHWDGMFPHVVSTIRGRKDISESAKRKILGENAKKLYGW